MASGPQTVRNPTPCTGCGVPAVNGMNRDQLLQKKNHRECSRHVHEHVNPCEAPQDAARTKLVVAMPNTEGAED